MKPIIENFKQRGSNIVAATLRSRTPNKKGGLILKKPMAWNASFLLLPAILVMIVCLASHCEKPVKPEQPNESIKTAYVVDYVMCSGIQHVGNDSAQAIGYYIISENLQDTFKTYNLSDYITIFPLDFFSNTENYRYSYKVKFEYEYSDTIIVCPTMYPDLSFRYPNAKGIKIRSLNQIN